MEDKDKFPRIPKNTFGDQTGWLYAGALVARAHTLIKEIEKFSEEYVLSEPDLNKAIDAMEDTINATMEAAYEPMANSEKSSSKS